MFRPLRRLLVFAALIAVLSFGTLVAQAPAPKDAAKPAASAKSDVTQFNTLVQQVIVPVTVTDDKGRFVSNLDKNDFKIFDEGREQKIDFFSHSERQPVVIGFLLDQSNGMKIHWAKYEEAASELMLNLLPGDKQYSGYLITYGNEAEIIADTSSDSEKMVEKLHKMKPAGGSALYDAIYMACTSHKTVKGEPYEPRRVIVIIGDGHDSASKKTLKEVIEIAQRNLVTIYALSTVAFGFHTDSEDTLVQLTEQTGGRVVTPLNNIYKDISGYLSTPSDAGNYAISVGTGGYTAEVSKAIFSAIADISGEITTQYVMRYYPDIADKTSERQYRRVRVTVPSLPGVTIRARPGYYPFGVPQPN